MARDGFRKGFRRSTLIEIKDRAFDAHREAKFSKGSQHDALYREKASAISFLLEAGYAFVNSVDWSAPDPVFGVTFVGGGKLHTRLSCLTGGALHSVRRQLRGHLAPDPAVVARGCRKARSRELA